jgi:DNA-binding cell septation regulator SpoVG
MHISIEHFEGKYPSFNVSIASDEKREPFLVIKGCRLVDGAKGQFISWPAKKLESGKYWNHVYASEAFSQVVVEAVKKTKPARASRTDSEPPF